MTYKKIKFTLSHVYWRLASLTIAHLLSTEAGASAIQNLEKYSKSLSDLVKGPLGQVVLFSATLGGIFAAIMKGSIWVAVGIFIIGLILVWHIDNIATVFK